ncbi:DUF551 domain-containing protein [Escherichia sp. E4736]|nr:DUF551 domain-containing protein [Escherichia sp. E4736]TGB64978.1 hypothetical protein CQB02_12615 [Escherichia coli]TLI91598.1 DUF551 domain-containing protein [Escherichia sp. E4736]
MSKIDYQALREEFQYMQEHYSDPADREKQELYIYAETLLYELDKSQQYIKRRDQENEDIALTVGRLRVELEAAKKRIAELEAEPVSQTYKLHELSGSSPVTPDGWISCSQRMPDDGQHVIILCDGAFVLYAQYRDGEFFDVVRNGEEFFETQSRNVTHWMPLPEPPQEVK